MLNKMLMNQIKRDISFDLTQLMKNNLKIFQIKIIIINKKLLKIINCLPFKKRVKIINRKSKIKKRKKLKDPNPQLLKKKPK